ncbi:MAG: hypothetical protein V1698_00980, partial [bacterium]
MKKNFGFRFVAVFLVLVFGFFGCGSDNDSGYEQKVSISSKDGQHIFEIQSGAFPDGIPNKSGGVFLEGTFTVGGESLDPQPIRLERRTTGTGSSAKTSYRSVPLGLNGKQKFSFFVRDSSGVKYYPEEKRIW